MMINIQTPKQTSFYLHSNKNRRLYPPSKYPLTHLLNDQSLERRFLKQPVYIKHVKHAFLLLSSLILITTIFFKIHILVYNSFFGPFHLNLDEFIQHMNNYESGQSWFSRIEFIQIELGEDNIQNPVSTYKTIRKYSDPTTRRNHIATYGQITKPNLFVKLPTRWRKHFHTHLPFQFQSYSIRTLQCIVKNLPSTSVTTYQIWVEKSEYIQYINEQYARNATLFNMLVLSRCGVIMGYLYRPFYDKAFTSRREHKFYISDIAIDATRQYCSIYPLLICCFIFVCLFLIGLFYIFLYLSNIIRLKLFNKYGLLSFPLDFLSNVLEELWLLNIDDSSSEQLLQLDEFLQRSEYKFDNKLFIIENNCSQLFIIILKINLYEKLNVQDESSPFIICPVTDIRKIVQWEGICYGNDSSWIIWPSIMTDEENFSEWLHEELMQISEHYKKQYEYRLRYEQGGEQQHSSDFLNLPLVPYGINTRTRRRRRRRQRRQPSEIEATNDHDLLQLIREEENIQRLKLERQQLYESIFESHISASPRFIAKFRIQQNLNKEFIDEEMEEEQIKCIICLSIFELNDQYARWPCPSNTPHMFHYECMLRMLRMKNTCPICRHPVEAAQVPVPHHMITRFFSNLVS